MFSKITIWFAWDSGKEYDFVITRSKDDLPLGMCGLDQFNDDNRFANLGYWIQTSHTKQGIATAAASMIARFGFTELYLNRVELVIALENKPSRQVAEKIGATREGLLRKRRVVRDKVYDAIMDQRVHLNQKLRFQPQENIIH